MTDVSTIWNDAERKGRYNGLTFCVADYGYSADTIVFDGGKRGYQEDGWESHGSSGGSRREATPEEVEMWQFLLAPPEDWKP